MSEFRCCRSTHKIEGNFLGLVSYDETSLQKHKLFIDFKANATWQFKTTFWTAVFSSLNLTGTLICC